MQDNFTNTDGLDSFRFSRGQHVELLGLECWFLDGRTSTFAFCIGDVPALLDEIDEALASWSEALPLRHLKATVVEPPSSSAVHIIALRVVDARVSIVDSGRFATLSLVHPDDDESDVRFTPQGLSQFRAALSRYAS